MRAATMKGTMTAMVQRMAKKRSSMAMGTLQSAVVRPMTPCQIEAVGRGYYPWQFSGCRRH